MKWLFKAFSRSRNENPAVKSGDAAPLPIPVDPCLDFRDRGNAALAEGRLDEAEACYRKALELNPGYGEGYVNLGFVLSQQDRTVDAEQALRHALSVNPNLEDAHFLLGCLESARGKMERAVGHFEAAVAIRADFRESLEKLAEHYSARGDGELAAGCYRRILFIEPDDLLTHIKLGVLLWDQKNLAEAEDVARRGLKLAPENPDCHYVLGLVHLACGRIDMFMASLEQALELRPEFSFALERLGPVYGLQGLLPEALACYRRLLALNSENGGAYPNLLTTLQYDPEISPEELFAEHLRYAERYEAPLKLVWPVFAPRDGAKRIRVGYVSPDFRDHAVAFFMMPILSGHDRSRFEVVCYHDSKEDDAVTERIESLAESFVPCAGLSDAELAERIRADAIDILVDLNGHFGVNRLMVFARKPAPIQVTWIGYPATTGLSAMDYRLTDAALDPPGMTECFHTETLVRLSNGVAFEPSAASPPVNRLPALANGGFTFGCLNNLIKINDRVIGIWARILESLPESRLLLGNVGSNRATLRLLSAFAGEGIGANRLILHPRKSLPDFLALHQQIDLALDTFPYTGGTTTLHSLWMGVPVLTLAGRTTASRQGVCVLTSAGATEFIAESEEDYVRLALDWAADLPRLDAVRQGLRARLSANLIHNESTPVVRELEQAYRAMWAEWTARREVQA